MRRMTDVEDAEVECPECAAARIEGRARPRTHRHRRARR
jgi:hypothetical protein